MAKTVPMIITNEQILVYDNESEKFKVFTMPGIEPQPNIPFYHFFADKISECQFHFKNFMKELYGKKCKKLVLAIVVPDDTTRLESIFINEFFIHSDACKAVAQINMGQALDKYHSKYISVSKTGRNVVLQYINNNEIKAKKLYDVQNIDATTVKEDAKRIHIDVEYDEVPIYINDVNMNMEEFYEIGEVISPKAFLDKIAVIDVEKV